MKRDEKKEGSSITNDVESRDVANTQNVNKAKKITKEDITRKIEARKERMEKTRLEKIEKKKLKNQKKVDREKEEENKNEIIHDGSLFDYNKVSRTYGNYDYFSTVDLNPLMQNDDSPVSVALSNISSNVE